MEEADDALDGKANESDGNEELGADEEVGLVHAAIIGMGSDSSSVIDESKQTNEDSIS